MLGFGRTCTQSSLCLCTVLYGLKQLRKALQESHSISFNFFLSVHSQVSSESYHLRWYWYFLNGPLLGFRNFLLIYVSILLLRRIEFEQ